MSIGVLRSVVSSALLLHILLSPGGAQETQSDTATLRIAGSTIEVTLPNETMKLSRDDLLGWVKGAANAVATYYGRFPVPHLTLKIRSINGSGIRYGVTYASDGGLIL